ncbi:MAG: aminotransferase class III-fold pyridoxal phosphate-dependent enzyme [Longimicrobiales bacterium]
MQTLSRPRPTRHETHIAESRPAPRPDAKRLDRLIVEQEQVFIDRQPEAAHWHRRAVRSLAGGVTSNWQIARPQPVWIERGEGSRLWDLDGNEYVDYHGGYGVGLAGHAHPAIVRAVSERAARGTHFAQPTPDAVVVAEALARRFGLPLWRFGNSGTESTMDAVTSATLTIRDDDQGGLQDDSYTIGGTVTGLEGAASC